MHVNFVGILIATVVQFLLGLLWYGLIFRKSWKNLTGNAECEKPAKIAFSAVAFFIANFLLSFVLGHLVALAGTKVYSGGFSLGVICWLGFMAPPLFAQHILERRRANLFAINAGYWLLAMAVGGALVAAFH
jgi:hypothetical protein